MLRRYFGELGDRRRTLASDAELDELVIECIDEMDDAEQG